MRFAVAADLHVGRRIPLAVAEYRREAFERAFTRFIDETIAAGVDYVFICGDLFERRSLRPHMVEQAHDQLYRLAEETRKRHGKTPVTLIIRGNHDGRPANDSLDYIKHPLAAYLHVFSNEDPVYSDDRISVVGLNYYDRIEEAFNQIAKPLLGKVRKPRVLLLHGFVQGYNEVPPYSGSVTLDQLSEAAPDWVFTGHYHKRCQPRKLPNGGWILTPGSTEVYDFAESEEKGFYIVDTEGPAFRWIPIEPLHIMKQAEVKADRRMPPVWYEEEIAERVRDFAEEIKRTGKPGYIRVRVTGALSEGWPSDIHEDQLKEIQKQEPRLLYYETDTMDLEPPKGSTVAQQDSSELSDHFQGFGEFSEEIREMHGRVRETLEEEASAQTGLLTASQRQPLIQEWLRRFEVRSFKEAKP